MTDGMSMASTLERVRVGSRGIELREGTRGADAAGVTVRPARVAVLLAQAHVWQRAIDAGRIAGRAALAGHLGVSRARVTQMLELLWLAPEIQEEILALEAVDGIEPLRARALRPVVSCWLWEEQRKAWRSYFVHGPRAPAR